ncbi:hypothetical protein C2845_PM13G10790 [Panicum miliaceum]|uniref:KIB1-4 beta-propeller domain-containing protein n=1 Tax=Panicum miliaceum TaxID=4540 RepID=A0A3L6RKY7_PANMI|nr:hypothetical protein C2845_PM13G10790 [Panicum miliaceum]
MTKSWEELPDLLGLVLHRLPSLADRVRLRAVCHPWRVGAQPQRQKPLSPPLPWLALRDGTLFDLRGAPIRCAPILARVSSATSPSTTWPSSSTTMAAAPSAVRRSLSQSWPLLCAKGLTILAAMINLASERGTIIISGFKQHEATSVTICSEGAKIPGRNRDIAFLHGKLYVLTFKEGLHALKCDASHLSKPKPSPVFHQCIAEDPKQQQIYSYADNPSYYAPCYLVESNGRLLMVRRWMKFPRNARLGDHDKTVRFEISPPHQASGQRWRAWVGRHSSLVHNGTKSVLASQCAGGVQEDCIYFMHRAFGNPSCEYFEYLGHSVDPLGDSGVYNMRDGKITPLLPEPVMAELQGKWQFLTWFFPADV